jgi:hypothetical protein
MDERPLKSQVLELLAYSHDQQQAFVAELSEAERAEVGTPEHWSAKDHIAHTMTWQRRLVDRLAIVARGETPPSFDDFLHENERNFAAQRNRPWADVLADDACVHAELLAAVSAVSDADLTEPQRFDWMNGRPLLDSVFGNTLWHVQEHLAQYSRDRGDVPRARAIHETFVTMLDQASMPAVVQGDARYNLACFYALTGDASAALTMLAEALRLNPQLTAWSRQDPDFASLRAVPAYQALYAS